MTAKIPEIAAFGQTAAKHLRETHGAAVCLADVQSANVVGYETSNILKDDYTMFGIQFEGVAGGGVKFKDLGINANGGGSLADADNILVWKDGIYYNYYFGDWGDPSTGWDNKWWEDFGDFEDASDKTIEPGTACWYLRRGDATTLTVSGAVKLTPTTVTILANDYTMFVNPYPTAIKFKDINVANPFGGGSLADADNILVWKDGIYYNYYFGDWGDPSTGWDNKWWEDFGDFEDASDKTIDPGIACWYLRRSDATTISFTSPLAK